MEEAYALMQAQCGIVAGDTVRVLRTAKARELGWEDGWVDEMDKAVGNTAEVVSVDYRGFSLRMPNGQTYSFPFYVLENITNLGSLEIKDITEEYSAIVAKDGKTAKIGCQTTQFNKVEQLYKLMLKQQGK